MDERLIGNYDVIEKNDTSIARLSLSESQVSLQILLSPNLRTVFDDFADNSLP
jgi:hypothetical protein